MVIRTTPPDTTQYWAVNNSDENLILQENGLVPKFMDNEFTYYFIDKNFIDKYLLLIENYSMLEKRKRELKERRINFV